MLSQPMHALRRRCKNGLFWVLSPHRAAKKLGHRQRYSQIHEYSECDLFTVQQTTQLQSEWHILHKIRMKNEILQNPLQFLSLHTPYLQFKVLFHHWNPVLHCYYQQWKIFTLLPKDFQNSIQFKPHLYSYIFHVLDVTSWWTIAMQI